MEDNSTKVLLYKSFSLPEIDDEYDDMNDIINNAEKDSLFIDIINSIGTERFEYIYSNLINFIRTLDIKDQIEFCGNILNKIKDVYYFEFLEKINIYTKEDVESIYKFLEFLELNDIHFFSNILFGIIDDLRNIDIKNILEINWTLIEQKLSKQPLLKLIKMFLIENDKNYIIEFLSSKIEKNRVLITINLFERKGER